MKHIRKVLAILLIAAMTLGFSLSASALTVSYNDASSITHAEAVDVLSGLNVIAGYPNGTFRPTTTITRAEIAKILAMMFNGGKDIANQFADASTFADSANHWAKGYIGFCVAQKLVNGKNASTFDPDGKVTCAEEAKMLLCALGYDAQLRGYVGADWKTNVAADAAKAGLMEGIMDLKNDTQMTRDNACQMMLNALQATMVDCSASSVTQIGDITYTKNVKVEEIPNADAGITTDYKGRAATEEGGDTVQLCEKLFPQLTFSTTVSNTDSGAPAASWAFEGKELGVYQSTKAAITSDAAVSGQLVKKTLPSLPLSCSIYIDGRLESEYSVETLKAKVPGMSGKTDDDAIRAAIGANTSDFYTALIAGSNKAASALVQVWRGKTGALREYTKDGNDGTTFCNVGVHSGFYYDETDRHLTITLQYYYPAQVQAIYPAQTDDEGTVTRKGYILVKLLVAPNSAYVACKPLELNETDSVSYTNAGFTYAYDSIFGEEAEVKVGDYVCLYYGHDPATANGTPNANGVVPTNDPAVDQKAYVVMGGIPLDSSTGTLTKTYQSKATSTVLSSITLGGSSYNRASKATSTFASNTVSTNTDYTVYYYTFGTTNVAFHLTDPAGTSASKYVYIYKAGNSGNVFENPYEAVIIDGKGEQKTVNTDAKYDMQAGQLASYSVDSRGVYSLNPTITTAYSTMPNSTAISIRNNSATVTIGANTLVADANTVFVLGVKDTATDTLTFTSYTGITNVPSVSASKYYAYHTGTNGHIDLIFLEEATISGSVSGNYGMLVLTGNESENVDSDNTTYHVAKAILKGQVTEMKLSPALYASLGKGLTPFTNVTTDAKGITTAITPVATTKITSMTQPEGGVVNFNGTTDLSYHANVLVYVYHAASDTLEVLSSPELLAEITPAEPAKYASYYSLNPNYDTPMLAALYICVD